MTVAGCPKSRFLKKNPEQCVNPAVAKLSVLCCSADGEKVPMKIYGCNTAKTFDEAVQICEAKQLHVCTADDLNSFVACSTGCNFNEHRVWTSTACGTPIAEKALGRSAESPATQEQDQSLDTEPETANEDFESSGSMPSDMPMETPAATPTDVPAEADEIASETANDDLADSVPSETQDADLPAEVSSETCQDFCRGKCKCLKPWKERCLVKSCAGCSECANV